MSIKEADKIEERMDSGVDETTAADEAKVKEAEAVTERPAKEPEKRSAAGRQATLSIRLSTAIVTAVIVALVALAAVFGGLWLSAKSDLTDRNAKAADDRHAEQIATDYEDANDRIDSPPMQRATNSRITTASVSRMVILSTS
jgi:Mce-associated membrane protein